MAIQAEGLRHLGIRDIVFERRALPACEGKAFALNRIFVQILDRHRLERLGRLKFEYA